MSLPWKKTKQGRISRLMSEFHQSPKRGLVVETGFPTSLIDLFFKNRDRLKKSSSKRLQRIKQQTQTAPNASSLINQDTILKKPAAKEVVLGKTQKANFVGGGLKEEKKHVTENSGCVCVLMAFKVLIVTVLALSTKKKLTIGITLSTFALLLTEVVTARMFTRSKVGNTVKNKNTSARKKIETFDNSNDYCVRVPESDKVSKDSKPVIAATENSRLQDLTVRDLLLKDEKLKSKSSGLKSKIVKKLRSYTKKKKNRTVMVKEECLSEVSSLVSEDKTEITESKSGEIESNSPLMESKGDKMNGTLLIVIVLTGLLSGKILAIVITLSCLVLRFRTAKKI